MRLVVLSDQLTVSLGGPLPRQLADGTRTLPPGGGLAVPPFDAGGMCPRASFGISSVFTGLSPPGGQVVHALLALPPLPPGILLPRVIARLACLIHAASVRSEPESNSQKNSSELGRTAPPRTSNKLLT